MDLNKNLILSINFFFQEKASIMKESVKTSATTLECIMICDSDHRQ